jgi:hypothetical protein
MLIGFQGAQALLDQPVLMRFDSIVQGETVAQGGAVFEHFRKRMRYIRNALAGMLKEGIRRGELRKDVDVDRVASEIVAFMEGIQLQWLLDPQRIDLKSSYQQYIDNLAEQIRAARQRSAPRQTRTRTASNPEDD